MEKLRYATIEDKRWIELIYRVKPKEIGDFNQFYSWTNYAKKPTRSNKFLCYEQKGFVRFGYSVKYDAYFIHEIGVYPENRREGIARLLFEYVRELANAEGKKINLKCNVTNEGAMRFYKTMGMQVVGQSQTKKGVKQLIWTT